TPSAYQVPRVPCTTDATCTEVFGADARCRGYCDGHTDPVWPCNTDSDCGTCTNDPTLVCGHQGECPDGTPGERCDSDADCSSGDCLPYAVNEGPYGDPFNSGCGDCEHRA